MKKYLTIAVVLTVSVLLLSCDDEEMTAGEDACIDASEKYLSELEDCLNEIGYTLGEDPEDMAEDFCESECDDLDKKVKTSKVDACMDAIDNMDCEELIEAWDGGFGGSECDWMEDDLDCD